MIGTLYKFSVLHTAISTIGSEIQDAVKRVGSLWHLCVFIWSCIFVLYKKNNQTAYIGQLNTRFMIVAILYLLLHNYVLENFRWFRFLRFRRTRFIAKMIITMCAPIAFLYHMWFPFQTKLACVFQLGFLDIDFQEPCQGFQLMTVALAALVTLFITVRNQDVSNNAVKRGRNSIDDLTTPIKEYSGMMTRSRSESATKQCVRTPMRYQDD